MDFTHQRSEETSSSENEWEDWGSDVDSEEDLFFPEDALIEPRRVPKRMVDRLERLVSHNELVDMKEQLEYFQHQQSAEINFMSQAIAQVMEREKMREKWIQRISTFEVRVPRPVVRCMLKHIILQNNPKTINRARCINRHFKCEIESEPYVEAIRSQNKIRAFQNVLQEFDLYFGETVYVTYITGVGVIVDPDKVESYKEWLLKNPARLSSVFHRYTMFNVKMGLKGFRKYCLDQYEMVCKRFKTQIETL
uniref:Uncharacterized protein n=1 Tax=Pithovirus LCPAC304 TaxID=2506594 RepID=A0A481Z7D3_9VIRU|nr:MAG: hypothetical protein LCPAC304_01160 [Pithovirus LCPAC304]